MMKLFDETTIAQVAARSLNSNHKCKRDGMSNPDAKVLAYQIGTTRYEANYNQYRFTIVDGSQWEIWLATIDEAGLTFYKNLKKVTGE